MEFLLAAFSAFFLLFASASCAPTSGPCALVRNSSLALNRVAWSASVQARNGSTHIGDFLTSLQWMDSPDICSPQTLKINSVECIEKMLDVLSSYSSQMKIVSHIKKCRDFAPNVTRALDNLFEDMSACAKSKTGKSYSQAQNDGMNQTIQSELEEVLCYYVLDRLFSFSILPARVFAVGDPARHLDPVNQRCM